MKKAFLGLISQTQKLLQSFSFKSRSRKEPRYFSREGGKLGFVNTVLNMLNFNNKTQQIELDRYFGLIEKEIKVSKQAYSEARQQINPSAIKELFDVTVNQIPGDPEFATIKGYMIVAVDGSTVALDNLPELIKYFGCSGPKANSCTGRISIACDTLNGTVLDAAICEYSKGERQLALEHVRNVIALGIQKPLFVFDRGYASLKLLTYISDAGHKYILRVKSRWLTQLVSTVKSGDWGEFVYLGKTYRTRVIRLFKQDSEDIILFSNVEEFDEDDFSRVYALRWPVETKYDVVKNKLMLENFTGKTVTAVLQDFWATMYLANLIAFSKSEADSQIEKADASKNLKYKYQTNTNILIGNLKDKLVLMLLCDDPDEQSKIFDSIIARVVQSKVPIVRGKSNPRKNKRQNKKFNHCTKLSL